MIALIAAVPLETRSLRQALAPCEVRCCGRRELYLGQIGGCKVGLLHSGVGKASAAGATAALLETRRPAAVVSFGCGGAYPGSGLQVGDLALGSEELFGDEGVLAPEGFLDLETLGFPLVERNGRRLFHRFPVDAPLLRHSGPLLQQFVTARERRLATGPLVTVSTCSGTDGGAAELARRTCGICENMEGAAIAQVCALYEVPFLTLRGISNLTEDRDLSRWDLQGGAEIAQQALRHLLQHWP